MEMEYRTLGRTGLKVSGLGFGVIRLAEPAVLFEAMDMGINYFDTARTYQRGNNGKMLGDVLRQYGREKVFIATKIPPYYKRLGMKRLNDQKSLEDKLERSLKDFKTTTFMYFSHNIKDPDWPAHDEMLIFCLKNKRNRKGTLCGHLLPFGRQDVCGHCGSGVKSRRL